MAFGTKDGEQSEFDEWTGSPAAPAGSQQIAASSPEQQEVFGGGGLQSWQTATSPLVSNAGSWYTGRNLEGTNNGWSTDFWQRAEQQQKDLYDAGELKDRFDRDDVTGVAVYDHTTAGGKDVKFGDVYDNGVFQGNIYDELDKPAADLMMLDMTLSGSEGAKLKQEIFSDSDMSSRAGTEVERIRAENNAQMEKFLTAADFEQRTKERADEMQEGFWDEAAAGVAGLVGYAATGVGRVLGAAPSLPTKLLGATFAGAGAYLNKDKITEDMARAWEITALSNRENSTAAAFFTGVNQWSGALMSSMQPLSNFTQGLEELRQDGFDGVGDRESAYYAVDEDGDNERPSWMTALNFSASIGDALLTFGSRSTQLLYTGTMATNIGAQVGELTMTGGETFDARRGGFDNIFTDDQGNFDMGSSLAGLGVIAIDAVQLGGIRGMIGKGAANRVSDDVLEYGTRRFTRQADGSIAVKSNKLAWLAPSEQVAAGTLHWTARREMIQRVAREGGPRVVSADDFYRAATRLASGDRKIKGALVNAFGEGYEEFAQAVLEPVSHDGDVRGDQLMEAFFSGGAAGFGMSLGTQLGTRSGSDRIRAQARILADIESDGAMTDEQFDERWSKMDPTQQRIAASMSPAEAKITRDAFRELQKRHVAQMVSSEADAAFAVDSQRSVLEKELERAGGERTDAYRLASIRARVGEVTDEGQLRADAVPVDAISQSLLSTFEALEDRLRGISFHVESLPAQMEAVRADGRYTEEDRTRLLADLEARLRQAKAMKAVGATIVENLRGKVELAYDERTTPEQVSQLVEEINRDLGQLWDRKIVLPIDPAADDPNLPFSAEENRTAGAQFASAMQSREPKLDSGSYLALRFHVALDDTLDGNNNYVRVSPDILQAINGDFDGDKLRSENQVIWSTEEYARTRAGFNLTGGGEALDIGAYNFEGGLIEAVATSLNDPNGTVRDEAEKLIERIGTAIEQRLGDVISPSALAAALQQFRDAIDARDPEARMVLLNAIYQSPGVATAIERKGLEGWTNNWFWMSQVVRANLQGFQKFHARHRAAYDRQPSTVGDRTVVKTSQGTEMSKTEAATMAQSLAIFAPGDSLFRLFQQIHYTVEESPVLEAANVDRADVAMFARLYRELSQNITQNELMRVMHPDNISAHVLAMMSRLVDAGVRDKRISDPAQAMTILANVRVDDVIENPDGTFSTTKGVTLLQALLKRAIEADKFRNRNIIARDEKMQIKYAKLEAMTRPGEANGSKAYLEVFGAIPFGQLLAGQTGNLPAHLTPEQWLKRYNGLAETDRAREVDLYKGSPLYLDGRLKTDPPYTLQDANDGKLSAYRMMVNAMVDVGNHRIFLREDGSVGGDLAEDNQRAVDDFTALHTDIAAMLEDFLTVNGKAVIRGKKVSSMSRVEQIQTLFEMNPGMAKGYLSAVPAASANALFEVRNEELYVANWVYETLAITDPAEAVLKYHVNLQLVKWNTTQQRMNEHDTNGTGIHQIESRFQQLLYFHAKQVDDTKYKLLIRKMTEAKSLEELYRWINTEPGVRGSQAPLLPFVDDVATFDATYAGGWVNASQSTELRRSIASLRSTVSQVKESLHTQAQTAASDRVATESLLVAIGKGNRPAEQEDLDRLARFRAAVERAKETPRGFGPSAMLALGRGVARMFDAQAHDKGRTMTPFEGIGGFQALMDAFGFFPGLERQVSSATAHDLDAVKQNLGDLINGPTLMMDAHGREVFFDPEPEKLIEMLADPRTAPLVKSILYPTALDVGPTGIMSERYLQDLSLQEFLGEVNNDELFQRDTGDNLSLDTAMRYISRVDAIGRGKGGSFDALRSVFDLIVARTSGMTRSATEEDYDRLVKQAFLDIGEAVQIVGHMKGSLQSREAGTLATLRDEAIKELTGQRAARAIPMLADGGKVIPQLVERMLVQLSDEKEIHTSIAMENHDLTTPEGRAAYESARLRIERLYDEQIKRVEALVDNDHVRQVAIDFTLTGDAAADAEVQQRIVRYIRGSVNWQARSGSTALVVQKLDSLIETGQSLEAITAKEWRALSDAAISLRVINDIYAQADHISVMPYPKGREKAEDPKTLADRQELFDPTFSYLAKRLFDPNSPLAEAAGILHVSSNQEALPYSVEKAASKLRRGVLNPKPLGVWTEGTYRQTLAAHERLDSAAAPDAIAAAGNGPKRMQVIAAATRRNDVPPVPELLSQFSFTGAELMDDAGAVARPEASALPVPLLDNRFFGSITIDGEAVDLLGTGLGKPWHKEQAPTGYVAISLAELRKYVERVARAKQVPVGALRIDAQLFHPDDQPEGTYNNVYFEGVSFQYGHDTSSSLLSSLWSANGGRTGVDTQRPLDAGKKGKPAWQSVQALLRRDMASIEARFASDFSGMLQAKALQLMGSDLGGGEVLESSYINAVLKLMKLHHVAAGVNPETGANEIWDAETIIRFQASGEALPEWLALKKLSPRVLRSMLGDNGSQGVSRFFAQELDVNPAMVPTYEGINDRMLALFGAGLAAPALSIEDTSLVNVGRQQVLLTRFQMTDAEANSYRERITYLKGEKSKVQQIRNDGGFNTRRTYMDAIEKAKAAVANDRVGRQYNEEGLAALIGPPNKSAVATAQGLLEDMNANAGELRAGWVLTREGTDSIASGQLTMDTLFNDREKPSFQIVMDDLVFIDLATFEDSDQSPVDMEKQLMRAVQYLTGRGATVVLGSDGRSELRNKWAYEILRHGYHKVGGSPYILAPRETSPRLQNIRAYESTLTERRRITPSGYSIRFLSYDSVGVTENAMMVNPKSQRNRTRKMVGNLMPTSNYPDYNAISDRHVVPEALFDRTRRQLLTVLDDKKLRQIIIDRAGPNPKRVMTIEEALDRLLKRVKESNELFFKEGDEIQVGDIVPFVHPTDGIIFYRHGFRMPKPTQVRQLQLDSGIGIAIAKSETEPAATANSGVIHTIEHAATFGRRLVLEVPQQRIGNKISDRSGMKYTTVPLEDGIVPDQPLFAGNDRVVDGVADIQSQMSKESWLGWVNNYRNALAFFKVDFLPDLTEFFFPGQGDQADKQAYTYELLRMIQEDRGIELPVTDAKAIRDAHVLVADLLQPMAEAYALSNPGAPAVDWTSRLTHENTATAQIAQAALFYLMTPGADVDSILRSGGFGDPKAMTDGHQVWEMPALFTDLLDRGKDAPVHLELIDRFNDQLNNDGPGTYVLHNDWTFEMTTVDPQDGQPVTHRGLLQFSEDRSTGDNPTSDAQAYDINELASISPHNTAATALSTGGITAHELLKKSQAFLKGFRAGGEVEKFDSEQDESGAQMWSMLTQAKLGEPVSVPWMGATAAEVRRRQAAAEEVTGFYRPLNREDWSADGNDSLTFDRIVNDITTKLNLNENQGTFVETWIRQRLGRPFGLNDRGEELGVINARDAIEQAKVIRKLVRDGELPVTAGNVGLIDVNHLTEIFTANRGRPGGWFPKELESTSDFEAWVEFSLGSAFRDDIPMDSIYLLSVDGFFHQYQNATTATRYLPASSDPMTLQKLLSPQAERLIVSMSQDEDFLAKDPMLFNADEATLNEVSSIYRIYANGTEPDPSSAMGKQKARLQRWRTEEDVSAEVGKTIRGVRDRGRSFIDHTTTTNVFWRAAINLRVGNALLNPAIIVWAPVEAAFRQMIHETANLLKGESIGLVGAKIQSKIEGTPTLSKLAAALGLEAAYTEEQMTLARKGVSQLASRHKFREMIYKELHFQYPHSHGGGKIGRALEAYAKFGARLQDPAWGMLPRRLATVYVESAMRAIRQNPLGTNIYSIDRLITELQRDPEWLIKEDRQIHDMAINAIADLRSMKATPMAKVMKAIYEPMSEHSNFFINTPGNFLKMTAAFSNFWGNFATTITGMQGASDFIAMYLDGKEKRFGRRVDKLLRGRDRDGLGEDDVDYYDMSDVIESFDLADSFIKGGLTHTALFVAWMGVGAALGGEDEEEKWRRLARENGQVLAADPRDLEADFRNRDVIYLDFLPDFMEGMFKDNGDPDSRASLQMGWVLKSYLSPIVGFERFSRTGDFSHVVEGFTEAVGSNPVTNSMVWDTVAETAMEVAANAQPNFESDDPVQHAQGVNKLVLAVSTMERYLLENSFINALYVGGDRYDRDPYSRVETDADRNIQVDAAGNPVKTSALQQFVGEDGKAATGYLRETEAMSQLKGITETRATLAAVSSLFFPSAWRYNMAVKEQRLQRMPTAKNDAEALLLAAYAASNTQKTLTVDEIKGELFDQAKAAGGWIDDAAATARAEVIAAAQEPALLSMIDAAGEHITKDGAKLELEAIRRGEKKLDDPTLIGVYIPPEMRDQIAKEWMEEITQEGVNMGLSDYQAKKRMNRIWWGPNDDPAAKANSLRAIVYSNQISSSPQLKLNQLNTTYAMGPDGRMYATNYARRGILTALGIGNVGWTEETSGSPMDQRLNTVAAAYGLNTGLRAVEVKDQSWDIPNEMDIDKRLADIEQAIKNKTFTAQTAWDDGKKSSRSGWRNFGGRRGGGRRGGGGGGYYNGGYANFSEMQRMPFNVSPYGNSMQSINTSNPIIRRADIRRERVWSERGRLKQWQ